MYKTENLYYDKKKNLELINWVKYMNLKMDSKTACMFASCSYFLPDPVDGGKVQSQSVHLSQVFIFSRFGK